MTTHSNINKKQLYPRDEFSNESNKTHETKYAKKTMDIISGLIYYLNTFYRNSNDTIIKFQAFVHEEIIVTEMELSSLKSESLSSSSNSINENIFQRESILEWYNLLLKATEHLYQNASLYSIMAKEYDLFINTISKFEKTDLLFVELTTPIGQLKRELLLSMFIYNNILSNPVMLQCLKLKTECVIDYDNIIFKRKLKSYCESECFIDCLCQILSQQNMFITKQKLQSMLMLVIDKVKYYYVELPEELKAFGLYENYIVIKDKFFKEKLRMKCYQIIKACILRCLLYAIGNIITRWVLKNNFDVKYYFKERMTQRIMNTGDCIDVFLYGNINLINNDYAVYILDVNNYSIDFNDFRNNAISLANSNRKDDEMTIYLTGTINSNRSSNTNYLDLD